MKSRIVPMLLFFAILLSGCSKSEPEQKKYPDSDSGRARSFIDDTAEKYPGKTVLLWLTDGVFSSFPRKINDAVNDYLSAAGKPYVVVIYEIPVNFDTMSAGARYTDDVRSYLSEGGQCDLLFSGFSTTGAFARFNDELERTYYPIVCEYGDRLIDEGMYIPLDGYLAGDAAISEMFGAAYFDALRIGGSIYGISPVASPYRQRCGLLLSPDSGFAGLSSAQAIERVFGGSEKISLEGVKSCFYQYALLGDRYVQIPSMPIVYDRVDDKYISLYALPGAAEYLSSMYALSQSGRLDKDAAELVVTAAKSVYDISSLAPAAGGYTSVELEGGGALQRNVAFHGVYSGGKHQDMAYDLLSFSQTDAGLNRLLSYGVEGLSYTWSAEDGLSLGEDKDYKLSGGHKDLFGNPLFAPGADSEKLKTLRDDYTPSIISVDLTPCREACEAILRLDVKYSPCLYSGSADPAALLAEIAAEFDRAGLPEIIRSISSAK